MVGLDRLDIDTGCVCVRVGHIMRESQHSFRARMSGITVLFFHLILYNLAKRGGLAGREVIGYTVDKAINAGLSRWFHDGKNLTGIQRGVNGVNTLAT